MAESDEFLARVLLEAQGQILERMADGADLIDILTSIAMLVERLAPPALCSIVLLQPDGKHLKPVAAPSLPEGYCAAMESAEIGPCRGSCGTAAYRKEPVIVTDIATDPLWADTREFTLAFGLRACWSLPILRHDGTVLGTIALYHREPRAPKENDFDLLTHCARLTHLALAVSRKEQDLRTNELRWQLAADAGELGTFDLDCDTGLDEWSPRMRAILGVPDSAPACVKLLASLLSPEDRAAFLAEMANGPESVQKQRSLMELRIRRADTGEERIVVIKGRMLYRPDGTPLRIVGTLADITEQTRRERELADAKTAAESANRAKSRFLANTSHELRTPLNAIIGFSDLIRQGVLGPVSPARYANYVEDIHVSGKHLLSLINDVLDMAKIEAEKLELHRGPIDIAAVARSALLFVTQQAESAGLSLQTDVRTGITLIADERVIRQVLTNLLSNAVKFTPAGGSVRLFGEMGADGSFVLGVEDTGVGMSEEGLVIALEPFGQVERDISVTSLGTGLGLPLSKALIEMHGASFQITSRVGFGTRAWATFPAWDVSEHAVSAEAAG